ncbi:MAG TPA: GTP cyclohydrolase II [Rhodocyclaceae bacterium]|nr:GTP cyclohydrolase II [Rhodocyclaceae bacterium]
MRQAERAIFDLRRGLPVLLRDKDAETLVHPVEGLNDANLADLQALAGGPLALSLTRHRLASIGHAIADEAAALVLAPFPTAAALQRLASARHERIPAGAQTRSPTAAERVAVQLLRHAQMLPAAVIAPVAAKRREAVAEQVCDGHILAVSTIEATELCSGRRNRLIRVSDARVPLELAGDCRFVLFRESSGIHEHIAVVIGEPADWPQPVPVRLHSSCLTGDVFGSQRCDCGEQLQRGIASISAQGGGVLLYLSQEGRGIGLGNKFRAYRLQDEGLDTIDADQVIGFSKDERDFGIAHEMLEALGVSRINLLTNNPAKIKALVDAGIDVADRQPLFGLLTDHNQRYLSTKADRHGHWLHELLNEQDEPVIAVGPTPGQRSRS